MTQNYSDPADQRTLASALSQTSSYSPDNLVAALRKKDAPAAHTYIPGQGMPPWAADAPPQAPVAARANPFAGYQMKTEEPGLLDRAGNWVKEQLSPAPAVAASVTPQGDQQRAAAAESQANADRLKSVQMAPDTSGGIGGQGPGSAQMQPLPAPRPQTVPEHWVNTMDPASRAAMAAGQGEQLAGVGGQAGAESAAANDMAGIARQGHDDARVQQLLDQQRLDPERQKLDQHAQQLQGQAEKLANAKVDPEHYMKHQSAGAKVMMAIGMGLSGFSQGLKGGPNTAMEMIKGAIDDDNRAQMQNIDNSKTGLKDQQGILADKMRLFGNKEQALAAARQEQLQGVAAQIDDMARQYQSPTIMAKAQQLKGELQQHFAAEGAAVQKYVPTQQVGGGKTAAQIAAYEADLVKSGRMEPNQAHAEALRWGANQFAENPSNFYQKPEKGAATAPLPEHLSSTNWEGVQRNFQSTQSAEHMRENERYNTNILAFAHSKEGGGIRDPKKAQEVYGAYIIKPGDSQAVVNEKLGAWKSRMAGQLPAGQAPAEAPPGFEPLQ